MSKGDRAFYVRADGDGVFTAYVAGTGYLVRTTLPLALAFIRRHTGRKAGSVDCFDAIARRWVSEFDLREGV